MKCKTESKMFRPEKSCVSETIVFMLAWIPYALMTYRFRWVCDDAFISFRYAFNWAAGNGLRYNLGDHVPVEGYSNFLWVAVCTIFEYFKLDITFWPLLLSFACGSILLYLVFATLRYRLGLNLTLSFIATLFLACSPLFSVWSTSGLETIPFALLVFVTFERLILRRDSIAPISAGIFGLTMALMRVEGICWAVLLAGIAIISRRLALQKFFREIVMYLAIVIIGYAVYWVFRYPYYQLPFANTVYVKVHMSPDTLIRGMKYIAHQFLTVLSLFVILPGIESAVRKERLALGLPVAIIPIVVIAYSILVSGDFMPMGRFLVPGLAFIAILFGWLLQDFFKQSKNSKTLSVLCGTAVIILGLLPAWDIHLVPKSIRFPVNIVKDFTNIFNSEYGRWTAAKTNVNMWTEKGKILTRHTNPGDTLVQGGIGAVGYFSQLFIYDQYGLVTRSVSFQKDEKNNLAMPGHDKIVSFEFFADKQPAILWAIENTRERLTSTIKSFHKNALAASYAIDIIKMSARNMKGKELYLLLYKRIEKGINPGSAWEKTFKRLAKIVPHGRSLRKKD